MIGTENELAGASDVERRMGEEATQARAHSKSCSVSMPGSRKRIGHVQIGTLVGFIGKVMPWHGRLEATCQPGKCDVIA